MRRGRGKRLKSDLCLKVATGILFLIFIFPAQSVASGGEREGIIVEDGRLTLEARGERAGDLLSALSERAGFTLVMSPGLAERQVSASFRKVPVEKALMRLISLMGAKNYSLSYDDKGKVREVRLLDGTDGHLVVSRPRGPKGTSGPTASSDPGTTKGKREEEMLEDEPPARETPDRSLLLPPRPLYIPPGR